MAGRIEHFANLSSQPERLIPITTPIARLIRARTYLLVSDWVCIVGTFGIALRLHPFSPQMEIINLETREVFPGLLVVGLLALLCLPFWASLGLYKRRMWLSRSLHLVQIVKGCTGLFLGYTVLQALTKSNLFTPSRLILLYWFAFLTAAMFANRLLILPALLRVASRVGLHRRVVLIGDSEVASELVNRLSTEKSYSMLIPVGILAEKPGPLITQGIPNLGDFAALPEIVELHNIEGAIITDPDLSVDELMRLVEQCVTLFGWVDVHSAKSAVWHDPDLAPDTYFDTPFVRVGAAPRSRAFHAYKRTFDFTIALLGLLALSPVLLTIAALIKQSSPGPVFFARTRVGESGRPFMFYKFRSMRVGAEHDTARMDAVLKFMKDDSAVAEKMVNEQMVTPIGRVIRKWALDEAPQLWNVLKGDMSLVGPRPLTPKEYDAQEEWQKRRFDIKPGCTSLWKVMSVRHQGVSFANATLYDIFYARNKSVLLDMHILARTALLIFKAKADG